MDIDVSQLNKLAHDLGKNAKFLIAAGACLSKASLDIKKDMAKEISKHPHFKRVGYDIRYDITGLSSEVYVETGRGKGHHGGLAFIAAYGTSTTPPSWDHTAALHRQAPIFAKFLVEAAEKSVL